MIKMIFEDNENMLTSILLRGYAYNGENLFFSNSATRLYSKLKVLYNSAETFVIFFDYVPDNENIKQNYRGLRKRIQNLEGYSNNVYIVPILCFEYILLSMLLGYSYIESSEIINDAIKDFNYKNLLSYCSSEKLEHIYKHIIERELDKKFWNVNKGRKDKNKGLFYESLNLEEKAERLYSEYPIFDTVSEGHKEVQKKYGILCEEISLSALEVSVNRFYSEIHRKMNIHFESKFRLKV